MNSASGGRIDVLDGMRGIAALLVVVHHLGAMTGRPEVLPRGYLAVDFFFMLSGFVMTRAYEARFVRGMTLGSFMVARVRRLYPVMAIGIWGGALVAIMNGSSIGATVDLLLPELLFLPSLNGGSLGIFRLDGVQWSLFLELVANVAHNCVFGRLRARTLTLLTVITLVVLAAVAANYGKIGIGDRSNNFLAGFPRVFFTYLVGILLGRLDKGRSSRRSPVGGVALMIALTMTILAVDMIPAGQGWWVEIAIVALVFPVLIGCGAGASLHPRLRPITVATGTLSYPLYAIHLPVIGAVQFVGRRDVVIGQNWLAILSLAAVVIAAMAVNRLLQKHPSPPVILPTSERRLILQ